MSNPLNVSDEEFLKMEPPVVETQQASVEDNTQETPTEQAPAQEDPSTKVEGDTSVTQEDKPVEQENPLAKDDASIGSSPEVQEPKPEDKSDDKAGEKPAEGEKTAEVKPEDKPLEEAVEQKPINYEDSYKELMAPLRANRKTLTINNPQEARTLMQLGANYTKQMQKLAPVRKLAAMLENNQIDENKLSYLIDLDKGDSEAVKKLLKDKNIDPLEIDTTVEPVYQEGRHNVSDAQVEFQSHLDELGSSPEGKETLAAIAGWDQASKDFLWENPGEMKTIDSHRALGIYDKITAEMDRRSTLGTLSSQTPFLEAYQTIGDELAKAGEFADLGGPAAEIPADTNKASETTEVPASQAQLTPVAVRTATPEPSVDAGDKAGAAAPSRNGPGKAGEITNFLAMSDEEFAKVANLKV